MGSNIKPKMVLFSGKEKSEQFITRAHILEFLREHGASSLDDMQKYFVKKSTGSIYRMLLTLRAKRMVETKHLSIKKHLTTHYQLTNKAHRWLISHQLRSFMEITNNPYYQSALKVEKYYNDPRNRQRDRPKTLEGFR